MKINRRLLFFLSAFLGLAGCHKPFYIQQRTAYNYAIDSSLAPDSNVVNLLKPYKAGVDTQMQVIIGRTDIPLTKAQPESTLGNFMADAQMAAAKKIDKNVVASIMNYGSMRVSYIAPGAITKGKMYELMPFDNMITIMEIPGEILKRFCNHMAAYRGWPVNGITYVIKDRKATGIQIDGAPVNDNIVYKIAVSDYIARGGDNCDFLLPLRKKYTSIFVRDALIEYVTQLQKAGKPLHPKLENRVRYDQ